MPVIQYQLSSGDQVSFQEGDTIGFSWTTGGVITYDVASANDYLYCENNVAPPSVGTSFKLIAGRYGNRLYSIRALYTPTCLGKHTVYLVFGKRSIGLEMRSFTVRMPLSLNLSSNMATSNKHSVHSHNTTSIGFQQDVWTVDTVSLLKSFIFIVDIGHRSSWLLQ